MASLVSVLRRISFDHCVAVAGIYIYVRICISSCVQDYETRSLRPMLTELCADPDLWAEADMAPVLRYLRGAKDLQLPSLLREIIHTPPLTLDADQGLHP